MNCSKLLSYMEKNEDSLIKHASSTPTTMQLLRSHSTRNVTRCLVDLTAAQHTAPGQRLSTLQAREKRFTSQVNEWRIHKLCSFYRMKNFSWQISSPHMVKVKSKYTPPEDQQRNSEILHLGHPSSQSSILRWNSGAQEILSFWKSS